MKYGDFILLNTTKLGAEQMTLSDSKGFISKSEEEYSLPANFYGNHVSNIAKTEHKGIYLLVDKRGNVFDILAKKDEIAWEEMTPGQIRELLDLKRVKYAINMTKKTLLSLLGIDFEEVKKIVIPPADDNDIEDKDPGQAGSIGDEGQDDNDSDDDFNDESGGSDE
jgi:hypothetical protein